MNFKWGTSILLTVVLLGTTGVIDAKNGTAQPGKLDEVAKGPATITVTLTNQKGEIITPPAPPAKPPTNCTTPCLPVQGWPKSKPTAKNKNGENIATFSIPKSVRPIGRQQNIPVKDVEQMTVLVNAKDPADLSIEAVFLNPDTGQFEVDNIFGALARKVGFYHTVSVPDLFADTNNNGMFDDGDLLYSLVDLNIYLDSVPSFSIGDTFTITDGLVAGLPGMMFATSPFVFDPDTGLFAPTDPSSLFSGSGATLSRHDLTAVVPEPGAMWLFAIGVLGLVGYRYLGRRGGRRSRGNRPS